MPDLISELHINTTRLSLIGLSLKGKVSDNKPLKLK